MCYSRASALNLPISVFIALLALLTTYCAHAAADKPVTPLDPKNSVAEFMACLDAKEVTLVSAHRGGTRAGFPENALESMQAAVAYGPMLLEVDVRETADGQLVLMHDSTLERTSSGKGNLADYTLAELSEIRLRDLDGKITAFAIPTLQEVLKWANDRAIVQLDVKRGVDFAKVARTVVDADAVDSTLLIVYRLEDAVNALSVDKNLSFSLSIESVEDLKALDLAGVPRKQIVAWTGVARGPAKTIWPVLESLDIPSSAGALWTLEEQIIASGNPQAYIDLAKAGLDLIAADYYQLAYDTLATQQDLHSALTACTGL